MSNQTIFNVEGTVKSISEPTNVSKDPKKQYWKQNVVAEVDFSTEKFKNVQTLAFEAWNNVIKQVKDKVAVGDVVDIGFSVKGNEWKDRIFISLGLVSIKVKQAAQKEMFDEPGEDDLPF